jgi:Ni/Fe-hydrogenase subunit HybB-like protein
MRPSSFEASASDVAMPVKRGTELSSITHQICDLAERPSRPSFWLVLALATSLLCLLLSALAHLVGSGIGVWGNSQTIGWAWDIAGFVFWIGIGHAGTLISAVLYLFRQRWRTSINRAAEAVTLFAVITAAIYPAFHLGRVWLAYWLLPAPNQMQVWPNFKSPLTWDVFAISTYFLVSLLFWYVGLIPDLATLRDRAPASLRRRVLTTLALGWRNSLRHWQFHERAYLVLAGLGFPLVVSVHTIVSFDFAVSLLPGWHSTLFPPYFVAGAVLSGSAMVATLLVLVRRCYGLEHSITVRHIENLNKLILTTGSMVAMAYGIEFFLAWYSGDGVEQSVLFSRLNGPMARSFILMALGNVVLPQLFWIRAVRTNLAATLLIGIGVSVGMWLERFVIVVGSLERGFLPSTWTDFHPTVVDLATLVGTFGLFFTLLLLFLRLLPVMSISELKAETHASALSALDSPDDSIGLASSTALPVPDHCPGERLHLTRKMGSGTRGFLLAECRDSSALQRTCECLKRLGVRRFDAHAPHSMPQMMQCIEEDTSPVAWSAGIAGFLGGAGAFAFQYWAQVVGYPMLLGGRPPWTWQTAIPIAFEVSILSAAIGCFGSFLWCCGLPQMRHPLHSSQRFRAATDDGFFVSVDGSELDAGFPLNDLRASHAQSIVGVFQ